VRLISRLSSLWRNVVHRDRVERDLDQEVRAMFALLVDENLRAGASAEDARRAAALELGGVATIKERVRDVRTGAFLDVLAQDARYAARVLRRNPIFALTAALSLAVGIGANTTIFTIVNALLLRAPTGVIAPDRLVDIGGTRNQVGFGNLSYPNYLDLRQRATMLDGVYACSLFPQPMSLGAADGTLGVERIFATHVTVNYFNVLGAVPAAGRLFNAKDDDQPGASPIAVLSFGAWNRRFNKDPAVVGRTLTLNGHPFTVVGVASEGFQGTGVRAGDVWLPVNMIASSQGASVLSNRAAAWLLVGGRLTEGAAMRRAAAEMVSIGLALEREYPEQNRGSGLRLTASSPVPGIRVPVTLFLALLTAIVSLVLIIACANLAGVLLARAAARRREMAVRLAMGAGRSRVVRQLLTETLMLFVLGGAAGLVVARGLTSALTSWLPALPFPVEVSLPLDGRAIVFTTGVVLVAAVLSGLAPALHASKDDVISALKDDGPSLRLRVRHAFVITQVAFSVLLVVVAGLFVRALHAAGSSDPGFDPHGVELLSLDLSQAGYTSTTGPLFARDVIDRVRARPDVRAATIATTLPGGLETQRRALTVPGVPPPAGQRFFGVDWNVVEPGYFPTLRIPIVAGRDFDAADRDGAPDVAIVGEGVARRFWPAEDAVGKYLIQPALGTSGRTTSARTLRVIGVSRDVKASSLVDGLSRSLVYVPLQQQYTPQMTIAARTTRGQRMTDEIRALVTSMNPNLSIVSAQTLEESTALGLVPQRLVASVSGSLGLVAALLAAIGIYGVTAYAVAQRTREIGIRTALGAQRANIVGMILRQGMSIVALGAAIGLALAAAATRLLVVFLFGVQPFDPAIFLGTAVLFGAIGLSACCAPVLRATHIDAMAALRHE
jgi:predicted permease